MKTMIAYKKGDIFNERIDDIRPVEKKYRDAWEVYPEFGDYNVKTLLAAAQRDGGWVVLINETPRTYKSEEVIACPTCGWPMRGTCTRTHKS